MYDLMFFYNMIQVLEEVNFHMVFEANRYMNQYHNMITI
jgi:hypothetical protein